MTSLLAAALYFVLLHLLVSGTRLRDALTARMGEGPYMGLFSLASLAGLAWLGFAFATGRHEAWNRAYWDLTPATRHIQIVLQAVAFQFIVVGQMTRNPTSVRQEGALDHPDAIQGVLRITRHPFLWGMALWSAGHLLVNGDRASIVLFGSLLALSLFGTVSIDAKRRRKLGPAWDAFAARTSNVPFAAILSGRQQLRPGEIGPVKPLIALAIWAALLLAHPFLIGVPALP